jgi:glycerophosphoryl diester phosphodiesterase
MSPFPRSRILSSGRPASDPAASSRSTFSLGRVRRCARRVHPERSAIFAACPTASLVLSLFLGLSFSPAAAQANLLERGRTYHMAHRGGGSEAPENTLAAFSNAIANGANLVECDLRKSADDVLVCHHDTTVDRTTDGTGAIADMTLAEIKALDAGSWFGTEFAGEQIPTLVEALTLANGQATIIIDPKYPHWAEDAAATFDTTGFPASTIGVWADRAWWVDDFGTLVPGSTVIIRRNSSSTVESIIEWIADPDELSIASAVAINWSTSTDLELLQEIIHLLHTQDLPVLGYIYNGSWQWDAAIELGMDGIIAQNPSALSDYFEGLECGNGLDDDLDTASDYPADPECNSLRGLSEQPTCSDGLDNDRDGLIDFPLDHGCDSETDSSETNPVLPCDDGIDNDGDYWSDTWDAGCTHWMDGSESEIAEVPSLSLRGLGLLALLLGLSGTVWRRRP